MAQSDFDKLLAMLPMIKNETKREMTRRKLLNAPAYFKVIPASSTGKYHPKYALGDGGLVRHTRAALLLAEHICGLSFLRFTQRDIDDIYSSLFLHDTKKQGQTQEGSGKTEKHHAKLAALDVHEEDYGIAVLILKHMGQWGKNQPGNMKEFIVHLCDYLASRRNIEVILD
jgi:hypothetical protein